MCVVAVVLKGGRQNDFHHDRSGISPMLISGLSLFPVG